MNKLATLPLLAVLGLAATTQAVAGPRYRYAEEDRSDRWEEPRRGDRYDYAEVVSAEPIYRTVRIEQPRRECWDERVVYNESRDDGYWMNNGTAGGLIGAIAGGVVGHQFGNGRGKKAATALGAVIGAGVGQRVAVENSRPRGGSYERVGYEERCETVNDYRTEQRVEAYDVSYRYGGRVYNTTMPYDPGNRIPVDVNVRPVRN
ncbi:MAG: glycine zipper 2TM domain-containing protein [Panacagrimonas sp.]